MITKEEYEVLKYYRITGYVWIARDKDNGLYVYETEPKKLTRSWWILNIDDEIDEVGDDDHLFQCIRWEDEKPTKINDLINDYETHQVITGGNILNDFFGTENFNIKDVPQFKDLLSSLEDTKPLGDESTLEYGNQQGGNNLNKSELIKEIEDILYNIGIHDYRIGERCENYSNWGIDSKRVRDIFSVIDKHITDNNKEVIPQFVADWIEECKKSNLFFSNLNLLEGKEEVKNWIYEHDNGDDVTMKREEMVIKAYYDGYEVEKEKLYTLRLANGDCLYRYVSVGIDWMKGPSDYRNDKDFHLTKSEIESVDPRLMQFAEEVAE